MNELFTKIISDSLSLSPKGVEAVVRLLEEGSTIPFISRYRKEATGGLDEVQIGQVSSHLSKLQELEQRKKTILDSIESQGALDDTLRKRIDETWDSTALEDIYLPYKPKRRTRAQIAREKGLEPLANMIQAGNSSDIGRMASRFVSEKMGVGSIEEAISMAKDIIAERLAEDERCRNRVRYHFRKEGKIVSRVVKSKEEEAAKFRDYFDFEESLRRCPSHRMLAMRRGESEGFLRLSLQIDDHTCVEELKGIFIRRGSCLYDVAAEAVEDGFKRLLLPSIQSEFMASSKEKADDEAIGIFAKNLEQLLMASPLGQKRVLAIDPGFRTGCKTVCLDAEGNLLHNETIYPHPPVSKRREAADKIALLIRQYKIEAISIGNGTAGRETESFVRSLNFRNIEIYVVSEDGASIYSASRTARDEFPDYDVTVRGAVSIGRRLMDPLSELVKIDASSLGVGQYQKDVDQTQLKNSLDQIVENCVNRVGVNLNTASPHLLSYVSGLGPQLAQNIVKYRTENGAFFSRAQLRKVPRLGPKAFEQAAGFLRIPGADNPLDDSAVHPESYPVVEKMARKMGCSLSDLVKDKQLQKSIRLEDYVTSSVGMPTLMDIKSELEKPGRDPRTPLKPFSFREDVHELRDLEVGMVLPGIVTNMTNFGCFVDVGVHTDGLVHISEMADRFVKSPTDICSLHDHVMARVIGIDIARKRLQLSFKGIE